MYTIRCAREPSHAARAVTADVQRCTAHVRVSEGTMGVRDAHMTISDLSVTGRHWTPICPLPAGLMRVFSKRCQNRPELTITVNIDQTPTMSTLYGLPAVGGFRPVWTVFYAGKVPNCQECTKPVHPTVGTQRAAVGEYTRCLCGVIVNKVLN